MLFPRSVVRDHDGGGSADLRGHLFAPRYAVPEARRVDLFPQMAPCLCRAMPGSEAGTGLCWRPCVDAHVYRRCVPTICGYQGGWRCVPAHGDSVTGHQTPHFPEGWSGLPATHLWRQAPDDGRGRRAGCPCLAATLLSLPVTVRCRSEWRSSREAWTASRCCLDFWTMTRKGGRSWHEVRPVDDPIWGRSHPAPDQTMGRCLL